MIKVIKRNGDIVDFNEDKIYNAILKAFNEIYPQENNKTKCAFIQMKVVDTIKASYSDDENISVETIQDLVENHLMTNYRDVAKAYIKYRYKRAMARNEYQELMAAVKEKVSARSVQNQNANVDEHSFGGRIGETADLVMKRYALEYCMSDMAKRNHIDNEIYIHDLSHYPVGDHNCVTIPFDDLLENGFNTRQTDVRPAQSVSTAFQLVAVIFQLQSLQQFGGVSASHLDWTMIPYVRKSFSKHFKDGLKYCCESSEDYISRVPNELSFDDIEANDISNKNAYQYAMDMTVKEVYQAVEGMYHNLKIWA